MLNQRLQSVEANDEEAWPTEEEEKTENNGMHHYNDGKVAINY